MGLLEEFRRAWVGSLNPAIASNALLLTAFAEESDEGRQVSFKERSFGELHRLTGLSEPTLAHNLKVLVSKGVLGKRKLRAVPPRSTYWLVEDKDKSLRVVVGAIKGHIRYFEWLVGAAEVVAKDPAVYREILLSAIKRAFLHDLHLEMDRSWLTDPAGRTLVHLLFSVLNAVSFWGLFYYIQANPEEAARVIHETPFLRELSFGQRLAVIQSTGP